MDNEKLKKLALGIIGAIVLIIVLTRNPKMNYTAENTSEPKTIEKSKEQILSQLNKELNSINNFNNSNYNNSVDLILVERELFRAWSKLANQYKKSDTSELKNIASKILKKLPIIQAKEFPIMRKRYGKVTGQKLWENDIYVRTSGAKNEVLNISGAVFASNMNIKNSQIEISSVLEKLRFKEVRYRWYKESDEYTYFRIDAPKDSKLVVD